MECKHEGCDCSGSDVQQDGFCSEFCRKQEQAATDRCQCGHASCG